ncbi:MAG: MGMT family protein [Micrococcus sp.]|nr:MGMT family protein [Micrococcus sp.]
MTPPRPAASPGPLTVLEALAAVAWLVPHGHVITYGGLAGLLGAGGPRQAGRALAESEPGTPWWRVVRADGSLPEHLLGQARERWVAESIPVRGCGAAGAEAGSGVDVDRVDVRRAAWQPTTSQLRQIERLRARLG